MDILIQALTYINLNAILAIIAATAFGLFVGPSWIDRNDGGCTNGLILPSFLILFPPRH